MKAAPTDIDREAASALPVVFVMSGAEAEKVRRYAASSGSSLNGLACAAVSMLIDVMEQCEDDGALLPDDTRGAFGIDLSNIKTVGAQDPTAQLFAKLVEAFICYASGTKPSWEIEAERRLGEIQKNITAKAKNAKETKT